VKEFQTLAKRSIYEYNTECIFKSLTHVKNNKALFLRPFVELLFASKSRTSSHHVLINAQSFSD